MNLNISYRITFSYEHIIWKKIISQVNMYAISPSATPLRYFLLVICLFLHFTDMGHLQGEYRETKGSQPSAEASLDSLAWVTVPLLTALVLIIALLFINQKKQWIPVSCYRTPAKVSNWLSWISWAVTHTIK